MEKMRIKVNGKVYDVEVEVLSSDGAISGMVNNSTVEEQVPVSRKKKTIASGGDIASPIAGVVKEIKVKIGDVVEENQLLVVLEAMKMNTNILSDRAGEVKEIPVNIGDNVAMGQTLVIF